MKAFPAVLLSLFVVASVASNVQASTGATVEQYSSTATTPTSMSTTIGGFDMTAFDLTNAGVVGSTASSTGSPLGGSLNFLDINGNAVNMTRSTADSDAWWINGESFDYDTFLISGLSWVEIILPENTRAISFNVGANKNARGWLTATSETDNLNPATTSREYFTLGASNTPGFGIYADNTAGSCTSLTSVVIDPIFIWGFGNFSINQDDCATSVPEASSMYLLAIGLFGLLLVARRKA